ncbi:hypothetical protein MFIFM68171_04930 [Madurella fahalii]|uniref:Uncharacterized protein n=1 Tax=Madurella fahalii TaxID=1157608 RepID=A0ABQ0GAC3_9PEZI
MSSSDSSSDGGWGYSNRYSPSSSSSSSDDYRGASNYYRYAPSSSSEDEDEDRGHGGGYTGSYNGGNGGGYNTADGNQHNESTPVDDAPEENNLNPGTNDSYDPPDLRGDSPAHTSPSLPAEHPAQGGSGDQGQDDGLAPKVDFPANSDCSRSTPGSGDGLEPGKTPVPANTELDSELPPLMRPGPAPESDLEDMPSFEDTPGETPPDLSIPERGDHGSKGDQDDEDLHSDHGSADLWTPDGEWIGLDPTLGQDAREFPT